MSWSKIVEAGSGTLIAGSNTINFSQMGFAATAFWRGAGERGIFAIQFTDVGTDTPSDPGFTNSDCFLQGKVKAADVIGDVYSAEGLISTDRYELDLTLVADPNWNAFYQSFPIMPFFRWKIKSSVATNAIDYKAWYIL